MVDNIIFGDDDCFRMGYGHIFEYFQVIFKIITIVSLIYRSSIFKIMLINYKKINKIFTRSNVNLVFLI